MLAGARPALVMLKRYEGRYGRIHGRDLDYRDAWWTPPLEPKEALRVERRSKVLLMPRSRDDRGYRQRKSWRRR